MSPWVYVFALIATFWLGYYAGLKQSIPDNKETSLVETAYSFEVEAKLDMNYAFDRTTGEFLGQHEDIQYLTQTIVAKKRPGYKYYIAVEKINEPV